MGRFSRNIQSQRNVARSRVQWFSHHQTFRDTGKICPVPMGNGCQTPNKRPRANTQLLRLDDISFFAWIWEVRQSVFTFYMTIFFTVDVFVFHWDCSVYTQAFFCFSPRRPWLVHNTPRYIEVSGPTIKKAVTCSECWGYDIFDLAIRRILQLDRGMYTSEIIWRLILESDFAVKIPIPFFLGGTCLSKGRVYHFFSPFWFYLSTLGADACPWKRKPCRKCCSA